jgi:hypothetical protein
MFSTNTVGLVNIDGHTKMKYGRRRVVQKVVSLDEVIFRMGSGSKKGRN